MKVLEDGAVEVGSGACARQAGVAVGVINLALLLIAQDAIGFCALAEFYFGFLFVFGVAVGMPLQRALAVRGLDLLDGGRPRNA